MTRLLSRTLLIRASALGLLLAFLAGCDGGRDKPPSTFRPDAAQKAQQEQQAKRDREKRLRNTQDCYIEERRLNPNKHTTCIYRCPDGRIESESVAPGFYCPTVMNVIKR